jgi:rhodanese-related sulfurtransferase
VNPWDVPAVDVSELPEGAVLLDVREPQEWRVGHIDGAVHVPMNEIPARLKFGPGEIVPERRIVVVCKVGGRSAHVAAWLNDNGFDAANLEGGMLAWAAAGRPMVADDGRPPQVA